MLAGRREYMMQGTHSVSGGCDDDDDDDNEDNDDEDGIPSFGWRGGEGSAVVGL